MHSFIEVTHSVSVNDSQDASVSVSCRQCLCCVQKSRQQKQSCQKSYQKVLKTQTKENEEEKQQFCSWTMGQNECVRMTQEL